MAELGFELGTHANSVEPAQTLHTSASDQDSHCLPLIQHILNKSTGSKLDIGLDKSGYQVIFFLFLHKNVCCGYSLEAPHQGTSNEYPQHMFSWRNKKKYQYFWTEKSILSRDVVLFKSEDKYDKVNMPKYLG